MSIAIESPPGKVRSRSRADTAEVDFAAGLRASVDISAAATRAADADELLALVAARACEAVGVRRCGLYLPSGSGARFAGRAAHPLSLVDTVRRLTIGGSSDSFTSEIVETAAPVLIRDAWSDPRASQSALRSSKVRSILGVPLVHGGDVVGVMFLDNMDQPHPYTPGHVEVAGAIGRIAGDALAQIQTTAELRTQLETAGRQQRLLRGVAAADVRLGQGVLGGEGLRGIAGTLAELTGKPTAIYNAERHRVAAAPAPGAEADDPRVRLLEDTAGCAEMAQVLRETVAGSSAGIGPLIGDNVRHRHLVAPVDIGDDRWGWVVVMEHPSRLSAFDELTLRRAAKYVGLELAAARRATTGAWDARSLLARQLIRGTQADDVRRSAEHLGIELDVPRLVGFITVPDRRADGIDAERLVEALARRITGEVLATKGPGGVAIVVDLPAIEPPLAAVRRAKQMLGEACAELPLQAIAGLSSVCRDAAGVPRAYREAVEVARCIQSFGGTAAHTVLAADDLGPGRLFVANGDAPAIDRFVDDVVGPLMCGEDGTAGLLRTLHSFFETGRSVRQSAARLRVHENTIRYRLARVHALTGLDVAADAGDQLSVQMALLVLRLQGNPALPSFDATDEAA